MALGWSSAPVSVLVPILELLLDPEDAAERPTLAQAARERMALGAVCRQWRLAVQQANISVVDHATLSPVPLTSATQQCWRLRDADLGLHLSCVELQISDYSSGLNKLPASLERLSLSFSTGEGGTWETVAYLAPVLPSHLRLRSLWLCNHDGVHLMLPLHLLLQHAERLELAGRFSLGLYVPEGVNAASFNGWAMEAILSSPCRQLLVHNVERIAVNALDWSPERGGLYIVLLTQLVSAMGLEAGGALDGVWVQGGQGETLWRVVLSAELPPPQQLDLLDLTGCNSLEQVATVVQARNSAATVRLASCHVVPAMWMDLQGVLDHPLFEIHNRGSLRRVEGICMNSMAFRALQRFPRLEQVLAAFDAFPPLVLPISVTRLELFSGVDFDFDATLFSELTHLKELALSRMETYRHLASLPTSLTHLELGLPAQVQLQRLRLPSLLLANKHCLFHHQSVMPLSVHLQHWQSVARRLTLRHSGIVLAFPGADLACLLDRLARCKWLKTLRFELQWPEPGDAAASHAAAVAPAVASTAAPAAASDAAAGYSTATAHAVAGAAATEAQQAASHGKDYSGEEAGLELPDGVQHRLAFMAVQGGKDASWTAVGLAAYLAEHPEHAARWQWGWSRPPLPEGLAGACFELRRRT